MKKKCMTGLLIAILIIMQTGVLRTYADDAEWVNPITGLTAAEAEEVASESDERKINYSTVYDIQSALYEISVPGTAFSIKSNAVDGMYTTGSVKIEVPSGIAYNLMKNGNVVEDAELWRISEPGVYVLRVNDGKTSTEPLKFTIVSEVTKEITGYEIPGGFSVLDATLDGTPISVTGSYVSMMDEGQYVISYGVPDLNLEYTLVTTIDRTAPEIVLNGVRDGIAKGPVPVPVVPEDGYITILLNGNNYNVSSDTKMLTQSGEYILKVSDDAGNENVYSFRILAYLDKNAKIFIAAVVLGALALFIYLRIDRKKMRVR